MRTILLLIALFISSHSVAVADSVEKTRAKAGKGDAAAQFNLGMMVYEEGQGVPQDYVQAHMWFNLAAFHLPAGSDAAKGCDEIAAKMTPDQIAEAQKLAREWEPTAPQP